MFNYKTVLVGVLSVGVSLFLGLEHGDNVRADAATMGTNASDLVELLQAENARLSARADNLAFELEHNPRVIPFEYDDCAAMFAAFYAEYPFYHYETEDGSIVIDYAIPNPEEDAAQYCTFIIDEFAATHTLN